MCLVKGNGGAEGVGCLPTEAAVASSSLSMTQFFLPKLLRNHHWTSSGFTLSVLPVQITESRRIAHLSSTSCIFLRVQVTQSKHLVFLYSLFSLYWIQVSKRLLETSWFNKKEKISVIQAYHSTPRSSMAQSCILKLEIDRAEIFHQYRFIQVF